jgi:hypothetical protein
MDHKRLRPVKEAKAFARSLGHNGKRDFLPFEEARKVVSSLGIKKTNDWITYCTSGKKPSDIPVNPTTAYEDDWTSWEDWLGTKKQKLTLAVSKDVIKQAKNARINISSMTERLLQSCMIDIEGSSKDDVAKAYESLFDTVKPILQRYDTVIQVGENLDENPAGYKVFLDANNGLYLMKNTYSRKSSSSIKEVLHYLYAPHDIIEKLIFVALDSADNNKKKIIELNLALRFLKVIFDNDQPDEVYAKVKRKGK